MTSVSNGDASLDVRRHQMLAAIRERGFMLVRDLSERFSISQVTVRSDLAELARLGEVHRIRGGAVAATAPREEPRLEEAEETYAHEKQAIGRAAAALIHDDETILLDVGSTASAFARALVAREDLRNVTVFTNGIRTALELEASMPEISVVLLGGTLRSLQHSLVEPLASLILARINVHTAVLGCNGVDAEAGVTNVNLPEAEIKKRMLNAAGRRIVLADGSKIGRVELVHLCPVEAIDLVVTGASADRDSVAAVGERGCEVCIAG
jgi:DeoR family transcriptional regulator of aga operon